MNPVRRCKTVSLTMALTLALAGPSFAAPSGQEVPAGGEADGPGKGGGQSQISGTAGASAGSHGPDRGADHVAGDITSPVHPAEGASERAEAALKVGFVLPTTVQGSGWSRSHQEGIDALRQALGTRVEVTVLPDVKDADAESAFRQLVKQGNRLIFGAGASYEALMKRLALEFPDVRWEVVGLGTSAGNIRSYGVRAYEGGYLAGVAAGKMTKTDTLGFVAPVPIPEVIRNIDAFALGAQSVNPTARVKVAWVNGWSDPVRETEATQTLINGGADVLLYNTATADPLKQAEREGKYAFGWGADMSGVAPKAHLGSVAFAWGDYYVQAARQVMDRAWRPVATWQGMQEGRVDLVALSDKLTPEARSAVEEKRRALRSGALQIWKGPLVTVDDRELLPAGKVAEDGFLESLMTYVKGVDGQVPAGR